MSKKVRSNGEGSLGKYKGGWRARLMIGLKEDGKPNIKEFYGQTQKAVKEKLESYKRQHYLQNIYVDDTITVENWFYTYMFDYKKGKVKDSTLERYESIYRLYILNSTLGKTKLSKLNVTTLQRFYNSLLEQGLPSSTLKSINTHLKPCLSEAEKQDYIPKNYAKLIEIPKSKSESTLTEVLTIDQQKMFVKSIKGHKLESLFLVALGTGLRLGEILGLKWSDIDFDNKSLTVNRSVRRVCDIGKDLKKIYKVIETTPKTKNSYRTVPIPHDVLMNLKNHKKTQKLEIYKAGDLYNYSDYVFCNEYGYLLDAKKPNRNLKSILKRLGIEPIKFHGLRKTYATRLFENDVQPKTVQALLGHSDIAITLNIYTEVMSEVKFDAVNKINDIFKL